MSEAGSVDSHRTLTLEDFRPIERDGEPRVRDLRLAERLEFQRPRDIRQLIERNKAELERYGALRYHTATPQGGGPVATEYWLNEAQALIITMRSDTPVAEEARAEIIAICSAYRRGELAPASAAPVMLEAMDSMFARHIEPVRQGVHDLRRDVNDLSKKVANVVRERRDFTTSVTNEWGETLDQYFGGKDPIDGKTPLRDRRAWLRDPNFPAQLVAQFHHLYNANRTGRYDGLPVCAQSHAKLDSKEHDFSCQIDYFHLRLRQIVGNVIQPSFL